MIQPGQVYCSCDPRGGPRIRVVEYALGWVGAVVVDADTGKRRRRVLVTALHTSSTTKTGQRRRTGYALHTANAILDTETETL